MVHSENPTRALDYFGEAQLLGAPERLFLADRGLARDLLGQQDAAQRDYQLALSIAPDAELTRRYALSLGISGESFPQASRKALDAKCPAVAARIVPSRTRAR